MLTPSIGVCATPLTVFGSGIPAASSTVGAMSTTWWNWLRISPLALMRAGQVMTSGLRVPPKLAATCLVHMNGVLPATAQPAAMCGKVSGPPHLSMFFEHVGHRLRTPLKYVISLNMPTMPPSALAPLSPTTYMISVLSSSPMSSIAFTTRPISWSVCAANAANTSICRANSRFSSAVSLSQSLMSSGLGASLAFCGMMPSCFCRANVSSRYLSQPPSNLPLNFAIHSFGT